MISRENVTYIACRCGQHMKTTDEEEMGKRDMKMVSLKASERLARKEVVKGKSDKGISKLCIRFRMEVERNVKNMGMTLDDLISALQRVEHVIFSILA